MTEKQRIWRDVRVRFKELSEHYSKLEDKIAGDSLYDEMTTNELRSSVEDIEDATYKLSSIMWRLNG